MDFQLGTAAQGFVEDPCQQGQDPCWSYQRARWVSTPHSYADITVHHHLQKKMTSYSRLHTPPGFMTLRSNQLLRVWATSCSHSQGQEQVSRKRLLLHYWGAQHYPFCTLYAENRTQDSSCNTPVSDRHCLVYMTVANSKLTIKLINAGSLQLQPHMGRNPQQGQHLADLILCQCHRHPVPNLPWLPLPCRGRWTVQVVRCQLGVRSFSFSSHFPVSLHGPFKLFLLFHCNVGNKGDWATMYLEWSSSPQQLCVVLEHPNWQYCMHTDNTCVWLRLLVTSSIFSPTTSKSATDLTCSK